MGRVRLRIPSEDIPQMLLSAVPLPKPRFWLEEDRAWSLFRLARRSGAEGRGAGPTQTSNRFIISRVGFLCVRIRARWETIYCIVVELAILNHEVIDKDRFDWSQTAAALLALHRDLERWGRALQKLQSAPAPISILTNCWRAMPPTMTVLRKCRLSQGTAALSLTAVSWKSPICPTCIPKATAHFVMRLKPMVRPHAGLDSDY
ncbi:hypothetical protein QO004_004027 [Rhizobium mesoamericanum]|nr:hypothetical protein [Rhizobium mesoamericanum]